MQQQLKTLLEAALTTLHHQGDLPAINAIAETPDDIIAVPINIEYTRDKQHGEFTTNIALLLANKLKQNPLAIAEKIAAALPHASFLKQVQAVAPGFINFHLAPAAFHTLLHDILHQGKQFGHTSIGKDKTVMVEFVSANPTGPLHVGHGRGAAFGDTVANLLETMGFDVHREYYVNDAGRQMQVLALSVWLRYLEISGVTLNFPANGYKGAYIVDIARTLRDEHEDRFCRSTEELYHNLPGNMSAVAGAEDVYIDALCERARVLLGARDYKIIFDTSIDAMLTDIRNDLEEFGVVFQEWFRESHLIAGNDVANALEKLRLNGHTSIRDGATWFHATQFGDDKDRVLVRANKQTTYFASDVGYHLNKYERGFDLILDVFGADHHGYAPRIKGFLQALNLDVSKLVVLLVQFAILYRGTEKVSMSTRSGEFVTLRELREEVGKDVARFFYIMRKNDQHLDFDLELAKSQSLDNPVYYIQYAHARICSVMRQLEEKKLHYVENVGQKDLHLLQTEQEKELLYLLLRYSSILKNAALQYEPHVLANYLRELAGAFHSYYNACQILVDDVNVRSARLRLISAIKQILLNGLKLLGVSCPESM